MSAIDLFVLADRAFAGVVAQIGVDQWDLPIPKWFQTAPGQESMSLRQIINYHAWDELWIPATLDGSAPDDASMPGRDDDHLGPDPHDTFADLSARAVAAVQAVTDLDRPVTLSYGQWTVRDYLWHTGSFRSFRAYDVAKVIGVDPTLSPDLLQAMSVELAPHFDEWRAWGVYRPAVPVPETASLQDKLIAGSGRDPR